MPIPVIENCCFDELDILVGVYELPNTIIKGEIH